MGRIYEEQATSVMPSVSFGPNNLAINQTGDTKRIAAIAQHEEAKMRDMYGKSLSVESSISMSELFEKYGEDPQKLEAELGKLQEKISSTIPDNDLRVNFLAESTLKGQTYLNTARKKFKQTQYKRQKSGNFNKIQDNLNLTALSFGNLLTDDATPDDLVNYKRAKAENDALINTLNDDGTFMFSDAQRKKMEDEQEKSLLESMKETFNSMEPHEKAAFYNKLNEGSLSVLGEIVETDNGKEIKAVPIQSLVSDGVYDDFKDYAERVLKKAESLHANGKAGTPEEVWNKAQEYEVRNQHYKTMWKDVEKENNLFDMLDFRNALTVDYNDDRLDKDDYQKLMNGTVDLLLKKAQEETKNPNNPIWWNTSYNLAIRDIFRKQNLDEESDVVKASICDLTYSLFNEYGIDPNDRYNKDDKAIEKIVSKVSEDFMKNKVAGLSGVEANKVVFGTNVYDYQNTPSKPLTPKNYKIMKDEQGRVYKVFKDASGNFSNNSIKQRIK